MSKIKPNFEKILGQVRKAQERNSNGYLVVGLDGEASYRYGNTCHPRLREDEGMIDIPNPGHPIDVEWVKRNLRIANQT